MKFVIVDELIDAFLEGQSSMRTWKLSKPGPLRIINGKVISFETVICERYGDRYIINVSFCSRQTEIAQKSLLEKIPIEKRIVVAGVPFRHMDTLVPFVHSTALGA